MAKGQSQLHFYRFKKNMDMLKDFKIISSKGAKQLLPGKTL